MGPGWFKTKLAVPARGVPPLHPAPSAHPLSPPSSSSLTPQSNATGTSDLEPSTATDAAAGGGGGAGGAVGIGAEAIEAERQIQEAYLQQYLQEMARARAGVAAGGGDGGLEDKKGECVWGGWGGRVGLGERCVGARVGVGVEGRGPGGRGARGSGDGVGRPFPPAGWCLACGREFNVVGRWLTKWQPWSHAFSWPDFVP